MGRGGRKGLHNALSVGAAVAPNVPLRREARGGAPLADLGGGDTLVVAIIPLTNVFADFDLRGALEPLAW